jgi:hypothetical protein
MTPGGIAGQPVIDLPADPERLFASYATLLGVSSGDTGSWNGHGGICIV